MRLRLLNKNPKVYIVNLPYRCQHSLIRLCFDNGRSFDSLNNKGITHLLEHCLVHGLGDFVFYSRNIYGKNSDEFTHLDIETDKGRILLPILRKSLETVLNFNPSQALIDREKAEIKEEIKNEAESHEYLDNVYKLCFGEKTPYDSGYYLGNDFDKISARDLKAFYQEYIISSNLTIILGIPLFSIYPWRLLQIKNIVQNINWPLAKNTSYAPSTYSQIGLAIHDGKEKDKIFAALCFPGIPLNYDYAEKITLASVILRIIDKSQGKIKFENICYKNNGFFYFYFFSSSLEFLKDLNTLEKIIKDLKNTPISKEFLDFSHYNYSQQYAKPLQNPEQILNFVENYLKTWIPSLNSQFLKKIIYKIDESRFRTVANRYLDATKANLLIIKPSSFQLDKDQIKLDF